MHAEVSSKPPSTRESLLLKLRRAGDSSAWELFVELYTPLIYQFARRRGFQDADACDVTQAVMGRVFRSIKKFEYDRERGRFRSWLGTITANEITRHQGRDARPGKGYGGGEGDSLLEQTPTAVDSDWLEEFNGHVLATALARIQPHFDEITWRAFDMTWIRDVQPHDAAKALGKSAGWIYKARFRVLNRLRAEVEFIANDVAALQRPS